MATTPTATIEGVWVTAFEENSFFPGEKQRPDPRDPRRFTTEIELDEEEVFRAVERDSRPPAADAIYLRFAGRRTREPISVDCYGAPYFVYIVDRLIEVRYLGGVPDLLEGWFEQLARRLPPPTVRRVHPGRWGELEKEAVARCSGGRGVGANDLEGAFPDDQMPVQARPPDNASAE